MRYAGLFEAIRVRASGYSYRKTHDQFYRRYRLLLSLQKRTDALKASNKIRCTMILEDVKEFDHQDVQVGKMKVFFRSSVLNILERKREKDQCLCDQTTVLCS